jgi:hypothetical protein
LELTHCPSPPGLRFKGDKKASKELTLYFYSYVLAEAFCDITLMVSVF